VNLKTVSRDFWEVLRSRRVKMGVKRKKEKKTEYGG